MNTTILSGLIIRFPPSFHPSFLPSFRLHGAAGSGGDAISATGPFSAMGHSRQMAQPQISGNAKFLYSWFLWPSYGMHKRFCPCLWGGKKISFLEEGNVGLNRQESLAALISAALWCRYFYYLFFHLVYPLLMIIWGNKEVQQDAQSNSKSETGVLHFHGMPCHAGSKLHKMYYTYIIQMYFIIQN